jgi:hypothetical protein
MVLPQHGLVRSLQWFRAVGRTTTLPVEITQNFGLVMKHKRPSMGNKFAGFSGLERQWWADDPSNDGYSFARGPNGEVLTGFVAR